MDDLMVDISILSDELVALTNALMETHDKYVVREGMSLTFANELRRIIGAPPQYTCTVCDRRYYAPMAYCPKCIVVGTDTQ